MGATPRIACIDVPLFPLAARLRSEPELRQEALVITDTGGERARIVAATRRARRAGIRPGHTLAQARTRLSGLLARARDDSAECAAQQALLDVAEGISPRVEDAGGGCAYLDISGLARLYPGTDDPERALAITLLHNADRRAGLPGRVGIAASKLAARMAALKPRGPTIVPAGEEKAFLAPLPIHHLVPEGTIIDTLGRWGIHSAGALANLPVDDITSRLGDAGRTLHALARGLDPLPLVPRCPPPVFIEGMELEWPLVDLEAFGFVASSALERLTARMATHGLGCLRLDLDLELEPDGHHARRLELPAPTRDVKTLLTLLRLDLERQRPGAPVCAFTLSAHPDRPRAAQLTLYGPNALSPERLATTLARLFALLGEDKVGAPAEADVHEPGRFVLLPYAPPPPPAERKKPPRHRGLLAVRVLRPPIALTVTLTPPITNDDASEDLEPQPRHIETLEESTPGDIDTSSQTASIMEVREAPASRYRRSGKKPSGSRRLRIQGHVRIAAGPWSIAEGWWTESPIDRVYWDIELDHGDIYRVYRDRKTDQWFADGIYD